MLLISRKPGESLLVDGRQVVFNGFTPGGRCQLAFCSGDWIRVVGCRVGEQIEVYGTMIYVADGSKPSSVRLGFAKDGPHVVRTELVPLGKPDPDRRPARGAA